MIGAIVMENRRKHTRFAVAIAAELELRGETLEAETHDVSEGGASVLLDKELPDGSSLTLTLILTQDGIEDPDQPPFVGPASVMWSATTDDGQTLHGLRFAQLSSEARARLAQFLTKLI
jgi:c-di-GMP-binding flagellar brake protein YcgR